MKVAKIAKVQGIAVYEIGSKEGGDDTKHGKAGHKERSCLEPHEDKDKNHTASDQKYVMDSINCCTSHKHSPINWSHFHIRG